jgi:peptidoglycan/LPS O-acetylase OafA/YrhL
MTEAKATYFKHLDGVRAIAVLMVVFHHWYREPSNLHLSGAMGVGMFFVLSGFLITNILLRQQKDFQSGVSGIRSRILKTFYIRRTLRIFPIYYLYVLGLLVFGIGQSREIWPWLASYAYNLLLFISNEWHSGYIEHLWSLAIEEQYYLIWPILLLSCPPKYNHWLVLGFIAVGMASKTILYVHNPASQFSKFPFCQFDGFGIGSALALVWQRQIRLRFAVPLMWIFWTLGVSISLKFFHFKGLSLIGQVVPFYFTGCAFFIYLAAKGIEGPLAWFFNNRFVQYLGKISYGIYLYHLMVPDLVHWLFKTAGLEIPGVGWSYGLSSIFTLALCSLSWYAIEQPINRLKDRFAYKEIR